MKINHYPKLGIIKSTLQTLNEELCNKKICTTMYSVCVCVFWYPVSQVLFHCEVVGLQHLSVILYTLIVQMRIYARVHTRIDHHSLTSHFL